jgi:hypothetical protein
MRLPVATRDLVLRITGGSGILAPLPMTDPSSVAAHQYRLLTRGDFDGIVCATLLRERGLVGPVTFVEPRAMQHGRVAVDADTITANLPYVPGCHLAFDHHASELLRGAGADGRLVNDAKAPSAARVIYEHFGGRDGFPNIPDALLRAVDQADSARFTTEEILNPTGYSLVNFVLDGRTGLQRFRDFRTSDERLREELVDAFRTLPADEILRLPDVSDRVRVYFEQEPYFRRQLREVAEVHEPVVVLDLRAVDKIYAGNRFMVYAFYPEASVSLHCLPGDDADSVLFAIGRSIINRTARVDAGALCLEYGGGGHQAAGTCVVDRADADRVKQELIGRLRRLA